MIKSITVTNHLGESTKLELAFPEKSGFAVHRIEGLGPSKANINMTEMTTGDGSIYNSARAVARNILMELGFLFNPTIEDVRQKSYKYFPVKKPVTLLIETDNRRCETTGFIESNEPNIFSKEEGTMVSILCPDPYFYDVGEQLTIFSGIEPLFESLFEAPIGSPIELSRIKKEKTQGIMYNGEVEVGIVATIQIIGAVSNIEVHNVKARESMYIDTNKIETIIGSPIQNGDNIIISTIRRDKGIVLLREGEYFNIFNSLSRDSKWFTLRKGENLFGYDAETGVDNLLFQVKNRIVYEGV